MRPASTSWLDDCGCMRVVMLWIAVPHAAPDADQTIAGGAVRRLMEVKSYSKSSPTCSMPGGHFWPSIDLTGGGCFSGPLGPLPVVSKLSFPSPRGCECDFRSALGISSVNLIDTCACRHQPRFDRRDLKESV